METSLTSLFGELFEQPGQDGFLLSCPQHPCGPAPVYSWRAADSKELQGAFLVLSWLLAFPSQAEPGAALPRAQPEQLWHYFKVNSLRRAPTAGRAAGWLAHKALVQNRYKHGSDSKWTQPWWWHLAVTGFADHYTALGSLSKAPVQKQIDFLCSL